MIEKERRRREEAEAKAAAERRRERLRAIHFPPPMMAKSDLREYLQFFEKVAARKELPTEDWSPALLSLLNDRFCGTASKLPQATQDDYDELKTALIERDESSVRNAAAAFWSRSKKKGMTALEHAQYVQRLADRFLDGEDRASILDSFVREVVTQDLPKEGRMYVRE